MPGPRRRAPPRRASPLARCSDSPIARKARVASGASSRRRSPMRNAANAVAPSPSHRRPSSSRPAAKSAAEPPRGRRCCRPAPGPACVLASLAWHLQPARRAAALNACASGCWLPRSSAVAMRAARRRRRGRRRWRCPQLRMPVAEGAGLVEHHVGGGGEALQRIRGGSPARRREGPVRHARRPARPAPPATARTGS